jgi:hypothetical protein
MTYRAAARALEGQLAVAITRLMAFEARQFLVPRMGKAVGLSGRGWRWSNSEAGRQQIRIHRGEPHEHVLWRENRNPMLPLWNRVAAAERGRSIERQRRSIRPSSPHSLVAALATARVDFRCVRHVAREAPGSKVLVTLSHVERLVTPV